MQKSAFVLVDDDTPVISATAVKSFSDGSNLCVCQYRAPRLTCALALWSTGASSIYASVCEAELGAEWVAESPNLGVSADAERGKPAIGDSPI